MEKRHKLYRPGVINKRLISLTKPLRNLANLFAHHQAHQTEHQPRIPHSISRNIPEIHQPIKLKNPIIGIQLFDQPNRLTKSPRLIDRTRIRIKVFRKNQVLS